MDDRDHEAMNKDNYRDYVGRPIKWGNPFRLTPDGFIQCYSINRKILDPWIMWSDSGGFEKKDIVDLYGRWLDGELNAIAPYLPLPPSIEELKQTVVAFFATTEYQWDNC